MSFIIFTFTTCIFKINQERTLNVCTSHVFVWIHCWTVLASYNRCVVGGNCRQVNYNGWFLLLFSNAVEVCCTIKFSNGKFYLGMCCAIETWWLCISLSCNFEFIMSRYSRIWVLICQCQYITAYKYWFATFFCLHLHFITFLGKS